jgi:hypothetical protein
MKRGEGKESLPSGIIKQRVSQARTVNPYRAEMVDAVIDGTMGLDEAYAEANRKCIAELTEAERHEADAKQHAARFKAISERYPAPSEGGLAERCWNLLTPALTQIRESKKPGGQNRAKHLILLVRQEGLEPPTLGLEGRCSIQLSYCRNEEWRCNLNSCITRNENPCRGDWNLALHKPQAQAHRSQILTDQAWDRKSERRHTQTALVLTAFTHQRFLTSTKTQTRQSA